MNFYCFSFFKDFFVITVSSSTTLLVISNSSDIKGITCSFSSFSVILLNDSSLVAGSVSIPLLLYYCNHLCLEIAYMNFLPLLQLLWIIPYYHHNLELDCWKGEDFFINYILLSYNIFWIDTLDLTKISIIPLAALFIVSFQEILSLDSTELSI